jgi:hypothetical protein
MTAGGPAGDAARAWGEVLTRLEGELLEHLEYLSSDDEERMPPAPFAPPRDMPPLPPDLRPRAERLLSAIRQVTNELAAEHERIAVELVALRRPRRTATTPATRDLDTRA